MRVGVPFDPQDRVNVSLNALQKRQVPNSCDTTATTPGDFSLSLESFNPT